jgi:hypothetical protein
MAGLVAGRDSRLFSVPIVACCGCLVRGGPCAMLAVVAASPRMDGAMAWV